MTLSISILRCPDSVAPQTRKITGGEMSIGRGPENDWVLPDPDRVLSKRHCVVAFRQGGWQVADVSSNGTYINREAEPLGPGKLHDLRDGDRLRLGSYELELRVEQTDDGGIGLGFGAPRAAPVATRATDPFGDDPFATPMPRRNDNPFGDGSMLGGSAQSASGFAPGLALPLDFDPLAPDPRDTPFSGPTQSNHSPAVADAFSPPAVHRLPDDWDLDFAAPLTAQPPAPSPAPLPLPVAPAPVPPVVVEAVPAVPPPAPAASGDDLLAAFLRGADMEHARPDDAVAAMERLGAAFRAVVGGIRQTLIARAAVKSEFRIEQTMIRARGNNPLKFSTSDDDSLAALIGAGRRADMQAADAVTDALRDIRLHELATMAAMQSGVRALLQRLDPAPLREAGEKSGGIMPGAKRAKAFELFEKLYGDIRVALADDFDSVFGKEFARAYEQALREASDKEQR